MVRSSHISVDTHPANELPSHGDDSHTDQYRLKEAAYKLPIIIGSTSIRQPCYNTNFVYLELRFSTNFSDRLWQSDYSIRFFLTYWFKERGEG